MARTISFVKGGGSIAHDNREFIAVNIDEDRIAWNETYVKIPLKEAYDQLFGEAVAEFNNKQTRSDRKISNYMDKIKTSGNGEKLFYENVVQIGKRDDTGVLDENGNLSEAAKVAKEILSEYVKTFQERNPNLFLFNAVLHMDEATPHLHLDYIPVAHGYKTGMKARNSLTKAFQEMGIEKAVSKKDNETVHWQKREREYITQLCNERGMEIGVLGVDRDNYTIPEYKAAMRATEELTSQLEVLNAQKMDTLNAIVVASSQADVAKEEVDEYEKHLKELDKEISERQKECKTYEKKIDKVLGAEKGADKELVAIKERAKPLPSLLGGEPSVKLSEKDFKHLLKIAKASGTMERLNKMYDKDIDQLQVKLDKCMEQIKTLSDKVKKYESFLNIKGLISEFKEFLKPKSIHNRLTEKKKVVEENRTERKVITPPRKSKGIAM